MDILKDTVDSLWQVVLVGLLLGAGLPAIFAVGLKFLDSGRGGSPDATGSAVATRNPVAVTAGIACFVVVLGAIVTGILYIMQDFLSHTFGITIF
ncbi:hypothetical protein ABH922_002530 [Rhodococcus sp. 27YEA15]|uniref:hypothetical protein n=1 Tax=Rhodococcus sp. 27YEA15 TaxID=3156259 RepID=UPI003C7DF653